MNAFLWLWRSLFACLCGHTSQKQPCPEPCVSIQTHGNLGFGERSMKRKEHSVREPCFRALSLPCTCFGWDLAVLMFVLQRKLSLLVLIFKAFVYLLPSDFSIFQVEVLLGSVYVLSPLVVCCPVKPYWKPLEHVKTWSLENLKVKISWSIYGF